jgi:hypothetical protein
MTFRFGLRFLRSLFTALKFTTHNQKANT